MGFLSSLALKACEAGIVPEKCIRIWCRHMLKKALEHSYLGDIEARHSVFRQVCKDIKIGSAYKTASEKMKEDGEPSVDFYRMFLGERLNESSAFFQTGAEDLNEAEDTMLWMAADRAKIRDGMDILEIGSGWGAMTFWLAEHFPNARIISVAESAKRLMYLKKKAIENGLTNVKFVSADLDDLDFTDRFDRVICIDHFELLNSIENWETALQTCLKKHGMYFLQVPVHASCAYYTDSVGLSDYPVKFIKYHNITPSAETFLMFQKNFSVEEYWKISGEAYRLTAQKWLGKLNFNNVMVLTLLAKTYGKKYAWSWMQRWKMYLIALTEMYGYNRGQEWITAQYLFTVKK